MPIARGAGGPALPVDDTGTPLGTALNPMVVSGAPAGDATIVDGGDVCEGAIADAAATAGSTGTISAKLRTATGTLGATADAAATAGSTGSLSAKMRLMTTQLAAISTALDGILTILTDVYDASGHTIKVDQQ